MTLRWAIPLCAAIGMSACAIYETETRGTIEKGGYTFTYVATPGYGQTVSELPVNYNLTFPDGTKRTYQVSGVDGDPRREMNEGIDDWLATENEL